MECVRPALRCPDHLFKFHGNWCNECYRCAELHAAAAVAPPIQPPPCTPGARRCCCVAVVYVVRQILEIISFDVRFRPTGEAWYQTLRYLKVETRMQLNWSILLGRGQMFCRGTRRQGLKHQPPSAWCHHARLPGTSDY